MKIMSLNVNRFSGMKNRDHTNTFVHLEQCPKATEIVAFVKGFLFGNPDGIVFLYEVPYCEKYGNKGERLLHQEFLCQFSDKKYICTVPKGRGHSCTLAIWNRKSYGNDELAPQSNFGRGQEDFCDKFVEIALIRGNDVLHLLGIHSPTEKPKKDEYNQAVKTYFENLKKCAVDFKEKPLIIFGDMNVHSEKPCYYFDVFNTIRLGIEDGGLGYFDEIKDGEKTHFRTGHTLDHVLVSPALQGKVTAEVIHQEELELSDHAVIIVNIEE